MTDRTDSTKLRGEVNKGRPPVEEPDHVDGMPVEELIRVTREMTARISNEDRKRLQTEASESRATMQSGVPFLLQQFFVGKSDLDEELQRRFPTPPLLTSGTFTPPPGKRARRGFAQFKAQDETATLNIDLQGIDGAFEAHFGYGGMLSLGFVMGAIVDTQRRKFLELVRRHVGISILWTAKRWERDYMIFIVQDGFARIYAFSANHQTAACRLTPEAFRQLIQWLAGFWLTDADTTAGREEATGDTGSW